MRQRSVFFGLVVLLLVLSGLAYWDERQTDEHLKSARERNLVFADMTQVLGFEIIPSGQSPLTFIQQDKVWQMVAPLRAQAEGSLIAQTLEGLKQYKYTKRIPHGASQPEYGLLTPQFIVRLRDAQQKERGLKIGSLTPTGYSLYFQVEGQDDVLVGSAHLLLILNRSPQEWRGKTLIAINIEQIQSITVEATTGDVLEVEQVKAGFRIKGSNQKVDPTKLVQFVDELNFLRAEGFFDPPIAQAITELFADKKFTHRLTWREQNSPEQTLYFTIDPEQHFLATFDPNQQVFQVPLAFATVLTKNPKDFVW